MVARVLKEDVIAECSAIHCEWRLVRVGGRLVAESKSNLWPGDRWRVRAEFPLPVELAPAAPRLSVVGGE